MRDIFPIGFDCLLNFSGHKEGPKAYKKWQKKMEDWFFAYNIPKHRKVRYAEKTLKGEALKWWEDELEMVDCYDEPDHSWSSMRFLMFEEFVMNAASQEVSSKDEQVSRTKLFEEGEYDVARKSTKKILEPVIQPREEDGPTITGDVIGDVTKSAEHTPEPHSTHNDVKINVENSSANLSTISGHVESSSKWNQAILSSYEKDMNFIIQESCKTSGLDQHALFEAPRTNQEDLSFKTVCSGILTQKGSCETWNQTKPKSEEKDIQVTSEPDSDFSELLLPALFGDFRAYEKDLDYKANYFEILTQQGESEAWNHLNRNFIEGVMNLSNKCNLHLLYLEGERFGGVKTLDWRPGEFLHQKEDHIILPKCFLDPWIRRIPSKSSIDQDVILKRSKTFKDNLQRFWFDFGRFGSFNRRSSNHGIILKISRYKIKGSGGYKKKSNFF